MVYFDSRHRQPSFPTPTLTERVFVQERCAETDPTPTALSGCRLDHATAQNRSPDPLRCSASPDANTAALSASIRPRAFALSSSGFIALS